MSTQSGDTTGGHGERALELIVVWLLGTSGLGLGATLAGHFLAPQVCIAGILLTGLYAWRVRTHMPIIGPAPNWKHLALLVFVCLFFRLPAFNYVLGGQDEGLYVNMAHHIERTGGISIYDAPLEKLKGTPFVDRYLSENRSSGVFVSGIYLHTPRGSRLDFQFYHLFPVWMAIFAGLFGSGFAVYALTFFALLSVVFMYRLALALTESQPAALMAGMLLALNPLHAFFSKFPVTEVPTLAFSLIGFTYLALFWASGPRYIRWVLLSIFSFGALFVTRISGFMYIPFFLVIAIADTVLDENRARRKAMHIWAMGIFSLYAISVYYGLHWSHHYSEDIYRLSFERIFPNNWRLGVAFIAVLGLVFWAVTALAAKNTSARDALRRFVVAPGRWMIGPVIILALLVGVFKIYQLGWTARFKEDPWLSAVWGLAGGQWRALRASSLAALFVYLGPLLPLAFVGLACRRQNDPRSEFLRFFAAGFFVYIVLLQWTVPYGPYYARYLLSEIVPYALLLVVVIWARWTPGYGRRGLSLILAVTLLYSGAVVSAQLGKSESDGLYRSLAKLLSPVDSEDVVLLDDMDLGLPNDSEIKPPIMFALGLSAITVSHDSLRNAAYLATLNARYNDVFLLSPSAAPPRGFESTGSTRIKVMAYEWNHAYPKKLFMRENIELYLDRLTTPAFPLGHPLAPSAWSQWLVSGWGSPGTSGVWSIAKHAEIDIDPHVLPHVAQGIRLTFKMGGLMTARHSQQRVVMRIDGGNSITKVIAYPEADMWFDIDVPAARLGSAEKIQIVFDFPDAATPQSLGINRDQRLLAIMLKTLTASPLDPSSEL